MQNRAKSQTKNHSATDLKQDRKVTSGRDGKIARPLHSEPWDGGIGRFDPFYSF